MGNCLRLSRGPSILEEFCAAKKKILLIGGNIPHELRFVCSSVQWRVIHQAVGMVGEQKMKKKNRPPATKAFVPNLGQLLDVEVPQVVLMNAFDREVMHLYSQSLPLLQDQWITQFDVRATLHTLCVLDPSLAYIADFIQGSRLMHNAIH
ncbi:unnamed protein product [Phytophthora fragariaefolia]|uniref:Unnamed protein product n=1 Tax=Phytophthora fragariaefolia TaxID=1490495 RepID=A0A9W6TUI5_9STRA|nr:unnamed protein product [Phytophthora fragariaefolia]